MSRKNRPERWANAVAAGRKALERCQKMKEELDAAATELEGPLTELNELKEEFEEWQGNMNENLHGSPTFSKLEAITSIEIPTKAESDNLEEVETALDECDGADLPKGFGRD